MYFSMWIDASQVNIMSNNCFYDTATGWLLINNHSVLSNFPPRPYILGHSVFLGWLDTQRDADPRISGHVTAVT